MHFNSPSVCPSEGSELSDHEGPQPGEFSTTADGSRVEIFARAHLPTQHGEFTIFAFRNDKDDLEHVALVKGAIWGRSCVPMRLHSECLTGDVFGSLKCDCREQLDLAKESVGKMPFGVILYMRQEGRGIGLANKIRAYALQDKGMDTVEANLHLGFDDDMREYDIAAEMVKLLGPVSVELMTNNPKKVEGLSRHGVAVERRSPIEVVPNKHNVFYLDTKRRKSGHLLHK